LTYPSIVRISAPNVLAKSAGVMHAEERVFDDDEKQRAWLEGCRSEEAISRLLERHGDNAVDQSRAGPCIGQSGGASASLQGNAPAGSRNFDRFYREVNFDSPSAYRLTHQ
jgi:hypothetical protein